MYARLVIVAAVLGFCWVLLTSELPGTTPFIRGLLGLLVAMVVGAWAFSAQAVRSFRQVKADIGYCKVP